MEIVDSIVREGTEWPAANIRHRAIYQRIIQQNIELLFIEEYYSFLCTQ